jgi:hypothetical protein
VDLGAGIVRDERRVAREAEIDEPAPFRFRARDEGPDQGGVVVDALDLPDDVVASAEPAQQQVQRLDSGARCLRLHPW